MKKLLILFLSFVIIIIPIASILSPIMYVGNFFTNAWGSIKDMFGFNYEGNFTEDIDSYMNENRISLNYEQLTACVLADIESDPQECLDNHDDNGNILTKNSSKEYFTINWKEWNGTIDDSYFNEIHVLGKYSVSKWEKVGSHIEQRKVEKNVPRTCDRYSGTGQCLHYTEAYSTTEYENVVVDDYDWVYHPEILRGKCQDSDTQICHVKLEDKDVYPFQYPSFNLKDRYGIKVDTESFNVSATNYQVWEGQMLYAFSKGVITEFDGTHLVLKLDANDIDLYAKYETNEEGQLYSEFGVGDVVEATEEIATNENGETKFYLYNSNGQCINPFIFLDRSMSSIFTGLGEGTIILGMEDFAPDFSNLDAYVNKNVYYKGYCGQCTWFAWGLFYQHYGYSPGFTGNGELCASQAYRTLQSKGWTFTKSPSPGAIFSTVGLNHVGIVAGVIDDEHIVIVEGNFNHKNDTYQEFQSLPDWAMRVVSTKQYKAGVNYVFCNPPQ